MTVISTVISHYCTAHATDSFITPRLKRGDKNKRESDDQQAKMVRVEHWHGIMSFFGLAGVKRSVDDPEYLWSTLSWMQEKANRAHTYSSPEEFAQGITSELNQIIDRTTPNPDEPLAKGIGIHFTAYEFINGYWTPELFFISNFTHDVERPALYSDGVHCSRQTFNVIKQIESGVGVASQPEHRDAIYRQYVHDYLAKGHMLIFNNGDTQMFNPAVHAILTLLRVVTDRGLVNNPNDPTTYRRIAKRPIEIVSAVQYDFMQEEDRIVGGMPHDLSITQNTHEYASDSGD
jgi:hypothetical protein